MTDSELIRQLGDALRLIGNDLLDRPEPVKLRRDALQAGRRACIDYAEWEQANSAQATSDEIFKLGLIRDR